MANDNFRELTVYKKAFSLSMELFQLSKKFPADEKSGLTSQLRRSSRSVCSNIGDIENVNILRTSSARQAIRIWKTVKHRYGWILHLPVNALANQNTLLYFQKQKKLGNY
jgi:hypothetical protein